MYTSTGTSFALVNLKGTIVNLDNVFAVDQVTHWHTGKPTIRVHGEGPDSCQIIQFENDIERANAIEFLTSVFRIPTF